jgi:class 3 adenylate cyclase
MSETRKIAAVFVSDVVGYSRLAGADEERALARLRAVRSDLIDPVIAVHHGRVVKRTGVEFRSVVDAVRRAIEVQHGMIEGNAGLPAERRIEFRIDMRLRDVVEESDGDLIGDGVAERLHPGRPREAVLAAWGMPSGRREGAGGLGAGHEGGHGELQGVLAGSAPAWPFRSASGDQRRRARPHSEGADLTHKARPDQGFRI